MDKLTLTWLEDTWMSPCWQHTNHCGAPSFDNTSKSVCFLRSPQPITSASTVSARTTAPLSTRCAASRTRSRARWRPSCQTWIWPNARPGETPGDAPTTNARKQSEEANTSAPHVWTCLSSTYQSLNIWNVCVFSGGRWTQITVMRWSRHLRTTEALDCWTSWIWPSLTSWWVRVDVTYNDIIQKGCIALTDSLHKMTTKFSPLCSLPVQATWIDIIMKRLRSLEMTPSLFT